jgi:tetratricopeptide (TPR) repeat protein
VQSLVGEGWWKQRLVNVFLHLGTAWVLYLLARDLMARMQPASAAAGEAPPDPGVRQAALRLGVALFALNPVAVYAVAYLIQRSIVMATLFAALACLGWVRALTTGRKGWYALAFVAYVLALLSKETALMTVLLTVPLYVFVRRPPWKRTLAVVGVAVAAVAALGMAAATLLPNLAAVLGQAFDQDSLAYARQLEALKPGVTALLFPLSILNEAALFFRYGLLWLFPNVQWMAIDVRPAFPLSLAAMPQLAGALAYVALLAGSAWLVLRRSDGWGLFGLGLLMAALLFMTEFLTVWVQDPFVLYRSYLWALPLPLLLAVALEATGFQRQTLYQIGAIVAVLFGALAAERGLSMKDEFTVWSDAAAKVDLQAPANAVGRWRPFQNRGAYYLDREMLDLALEDFSRAEQLGETQGAARFSRGVSLQLLRRYGEALIAFDQAEAIGFREAALYLHRGETQAAVGRYPQALDSFSKALAKVQAPGVAEHTRLRRAEAAAAAGQSDLAISDFQALLAAKPGDERYQIGLGLAYIGKDQAAPAKAIFEQLLATRPSAMAYYGRGLASVVAGQKAAGLADLDRAIELEPKNDMFKAVRGRVLAQK